MNTATRFLIFLACIGAFALSSIIDRMAAVNIEEAWSVLRGEGYDYQIERDWKQVHPGGVLVGSALTVTYMPLRPVANEVTNVKGGAAQGKNMVNLS